MKRSLGPGLLGWLQLGPECLRQPGWRPTLPAEWGHTCQGQPLAALGEGRACALPAPPRLQTHVVQAAVRIGAPHLPRQLPVCLPPEGGAVKVFPGTAYTHFDLTPWLLCEGALSLSLMGFGSLCLQFRQEGPGSRGSSWREITRACSLSRRSCGHPLLGEILAGCPERVQLGRPQHPVPGDVVGSPLQGRGSPVPAALLNGMTGPWAPSWRILEGRRGALGWALWWGPPAGLLQGPWSIVSRVVVP